MAIPSLKTPKLLGRAESLLLLATLFCSANCNAVQQVVFSGEAKTYFFADDLSQSFSRAVGGDFNGDGSVDLAFVNSTKISVRFNSNNDFSQRTNSDLQIWQPNLLLAVDFNGDQKCDLIAGSQFFLNNGDGTFTPAENPIGKSILAAADFNHDQILDFITDDAQVWFGQGNGDGQGNGEYQFATNLPSNKVAVGDFVGNGGKQFAVVSSGDSGSEVLLYEWNDIAFSVFTNSINADAIRAGDLNGDGRDDLIAFRASEIEILLRNNEDGFTSVSNFLRSPLELDKIAIVGDFNDDGINDLLTLEQTYFTDRFPCTIRFGNGSSLGPPVKYEFGFLTTADLDGDNKPDLVRFSPDFYSSFGVVLSSKHAFKNLLTKHVGVALAVGDWNGDGRDDLIEIGVNSIAVKSWLANEQGNFPSPSQEFSQDSVMLYNYFRLPSADFNNDGKLDVVFLTTNGVQTMLGNGDGTFTDGPIFGINGQVSKMRAGDINGDGKQDLILLYRSSANQPAIGVLLGDGNGGFVGPMRKIEGKATDVILADINRDGKLDIIACEDSIKIYHGQGNGTFVLATTLFPNNSTLRWLACADFDDDGLMDIATSSKNGLKLSFQTSLGVFSSFRNYPGTDYMSYIEVHDFNGDGKPDIFGWDEYKKTYSRFILLNKGNANFEMQTLTDTLPFNVGDYNGDGKPDLLTFHSVLLNQTPFQKRVDLVWQNQNGTVADWFLRGTNFISGSTLLKAGEVARGWKLATSADFNGDSTRDWLWRNDDGRLAIWFLDGTNVLSKAELRRGSPSSLGWRLVGAADFNGDSSPDLLWQNQDGRNAIWLINGTNFVSAVSLRSASPNWRMVAADDFDHDQHPDILWQNDKGQLAIWFMNGTNFVRSALIRNGQSINPQWQAKILADLNDDGEQDIVFQHADGRLAVWLMNGGEFVQGVPLRNRTAGPGWSVVGAR